MGSEIKLAIQANTWLVLKLIVKFYVLDRRPACQIAAKMAPIMPCRPNRLNEQVLKMLFSCATFFSTRFITSTCTSADTTPITSAQVGLMIQQLAVTEATPPAIGPQMMSRTTTPLLSRGETMKDVRVAAQREKMTLQAPVQGVWEATTGSMQSRARTGKKIQVRRVPMRVKATDVLSPVQFWFWAVVVSGFLSLRYLNSPITKPMKPPKTKIALAPPESLVQFSMICLLSSQPIVPKMTTMKASRGPALPMIAEKATKFDRAHLKAPAIVAALRVGSIRLVRKKLQVLSDWLKTFKLLLVQAMVALVQKAFIMKYIQIESAVMRRAKPRPLQSIFLRKENSSPNPEQDGGYR